MRRALRASDPRGGSPDTGSVFRAMRALRSNLADEEAFVRTVDDVQRPEDYRLVGAFEQDGSEAVAVAGFRTAQSLAWGHHLYVDDLSTLPDPDVVAESPRSAIGGDTLDKLLRSDWRYGRAPAGASQIDSNSNTSASVS